MFEQSTSIEHLDPEIQYLIKLLELGLYIRGWDGPGTPYVILDKCPDRGYLYNVVPLHLVNFCSFSDSLNTDVENKLRKLPIIRYFDGKFINHHDDRFPSEIVQSIGNLINAIADKRFGCFPASGFFISTSLYHLEHSYHYIVPNIDITTLKEFW